MALTWKKDNRIIWGKDPGPNYENPHLWPKGWDSYKKYSFNSKSNPRFTTVGAKHSFKYGLAMVPTPLYFFSTCIFFPVFSIFICSLEYSLWFNRYRIWFNLYRIQEGKQEIAESTEEPVWCQAELAILGSSSHPLSSKAPYKFTALHTWFDHLMHAYFSFEDCT